MECAIELEATGAQRGKRRLGTSRLQSMSFNWLNIDLPFPLESLFLSVIIPAYSINSCSTFVPSTFEEFGEAWAKAGAAVIE